jgi:peptide/nickel transport system substrate-binding protein
LEFKLRPNAAFHDGAAFDADDVVFSLDRARSDGSDMRSLLSSVERVVKVDPQAVRVTTRSPDPLLPNNLTDILVMHQSWAERHGAVRPAGAGESPAARSANGTGPYVLVSREPGVRTVLHRNEGYWGRGEAPLDIDEVVFRPIPDGRARVEALLASEVDFLQDVPVGRSRASPRRRTSASIPARRTAPSSSGSTSARPSCAPPTSGAEIPSPTAACERPKQVLTGWPTDARCGSMVWSGSG